MKILPVIFASILFSILILTPHTSFADNDPLRAFSSESVVGAKQLASTLSSTAWVYHYSGRDYPFRFGASGLIERFPEWPNVHWRVISPTEVLLDRPQGGSVVFRFNEDVTTFKGNDWDTKSVTGSRDLSKSAG